jgi:hypothetical protein
MNQASDANAGIDNADVQAPNANTAKKQVLITDNGDGTFDVQEMQDGQPVGDATTASSVDDAFKGIRDTLGAVSGSEPPKTGPEAENALAGATEPSVEQSSDNTEVGSGVPEAGMESDAEAKAKYAQKRGTRPKTAPSWSDYTTGGNPTAK